MIGVDTNVLARLFVDDGSPERQRVMTYFATRDEREIAYVSIIVLVEFVWLLSSRYEFTRAAVIDALSALLRNAGFVIQREGLVVEAVEHARANGTGIADYLVSVLGSEAGCTATLTFDREAARRVPGMELLR
jgi:predicted nucleic-acid-binding protein